MKGRASSHRTTGHNGLDLLLLHPPDFVGRKPEVAVATIREERYLPLGPLALASFLGRFGHRVMVAPLREFYQNHGCYLDYDDGSPEAVTRFRRKTALILGRLVQQLNPRAIGISHNYALHERAVSILLDTLRRDHPGLPVVLGGVHATMTSESWLRNDAAPDAVVLGEGEMTCQRLLASGFATDGIDGLAVRKSSGDVEIRARPAPLHGADISVPLDADLVALPRWSSFADLLHYAHFSRGCAWKCAFCCSPQMWGRRRVRDPQAVSTELEDLQRRGAREVFLTDEALLPRAGGFGHMLDVLRRFSDLRFCGLMRPDHLADFDFSRLRQANVQLVYIGVESFSSRVQRAMHKRLDGLGFRRLAGSLKRMNDAGVKATLLVMLGYPHGGLAEDTRTLNACRRLARDGLLWDIGVAHTAPFPGTRLALEKPRRFRIVEPRTHYWNLSEPVIELVDARGRVSYSAAQMRSVYDGLEAIRLEYGLGPHRSGVGNGLGLGG